MARFTISSFKTGGKAPETIAVQNYNAAINRAEAESEVGKITDPNVYIDAANLYLKPFTNDPGVLTSYYQALSNAKSLAASAQDQDYTKRLYEQSLEETVQEATAEALKNATNPAEAVASINAYYHDAAAGKLQAEIDQRQRNLQSVDSLLPILENYQKKANDFTELYNDMLSGAKKVDRNNYGLFVQTNPNTGRIVSTKMQAVDSLSNPPQGYMKTTDDFGVPLYLNTYSDGTKARLGDKEYKVEKVAGKTGNTIKMAVGSDIHKGFISKLKAWGQSGVGAQFSEEDLKRTELPNLNTEYDGYLNLPPDSALRDTKGNYYYLSQDGNLYKGHREQIAQMFGVTTQEVENNSYLITQNNLSRIGQVKNLDEVLNGPSQNIVPSAPVTQSGLPIATGGVANESMPLAEYTRRQGAIQQPQGQELQKKNILGIVKGGIKGLANLGKRIFG